MEEAASATQGGKRRAIWGPSMEPPLHPQAPGPCSQIHNGIRRGREGKVMSNVRKSERWRADNTPSTPPPSHPPSLCPTVAQLNITFIKSLTRKKAGSQRPPSLSVIWKASPGANLGNHLSTDSPAPVPHCTSSRSRALCFHAPADVFRRRSVKSLPPPCGTFRRVLEVTCHSLRIVHLLSSAANESFRPTPHAVQVVLG